MTHAATSAPSAPTDNTLRRFLHARPGVLAYAGLAMLGLAFLFVAFSIVGGVRQYLPIPYWDMWSGYVGFMTRSDLSTWQAWWGQHNEHRILLSRLLFWVDFRLFGASLIFLVVVNYLLAAGAALLFIWALRQRVGVLSLSSGAFLIAALVPVAGFSWLQFENFNWAFQSQFFLAQSVPLAALLALYRSGRDGSLGWFICAVLLGVAACATMANGVAALPLLVVMAIGCRFSRRRVCALAAATVAMLAFYFSDYRSAQASRSLDVVAQHAFELMQYTLVYLGSPVYAGTRGSATLAALAGLFLAGTAVYFLIDAVRRKPHDHLAVALSLFVLYVAATALLTAFGRYDHGVGQAASSRYQTPALMAWVALLVLLAPTMLRGFTRWPRVGSVAMLLIPLVLMPQQRLALQSDREDAFERWVAVLALEMGVADQRQIAQIYPSAAHALFLSEPLKTFDLAAFGDPVLDPVDDTMGKITPSSASLTPCAGAIVSVLAVPGESRFVRVDGTISSPWLRRTRTLVSILDTNRRVTGFALTLERGRTAKNDASSLFDLTRFAGYIEANAVPGRLTLVGDEPDCELSLLVSERPSTMLR